MKTYGLPSPHLPPCSECGGETRYLDCEECEEKGIECLEVICCECGETQEGR